MSISERLPKMPVIFQESPTRAMLETAPLAHPNPRSVMRTLSEFDVVGEAAGRAGIEGRTAHEVGAQLLFCSRELRCMRI